MLNFKGGVQLLNGTNKRRQIRIKTLNWINLNAELSSLVGSIQPLPKWELSLVARRDSRGSNIAF